MSMHWCERFQRSLRLTPKCPALTLVYYISFQITKIDQVLQEKGTVIIIEYPPFSFIYLASNPGLPLSTWEGLAEYVMK